MSPVLLYQLNDLLLTLVSFQDSMSRWPGFDHILPLGHAEVRRKRKDWLFSFSHWEMSSLPQDVTWVNFQRNWNSKRNREGILGKLQ